MVEENWRQLLTFGAQGSQAMGAAVVKRFDEKIEKQAATLDPAGSKEFLAAVEEERDRLFDEYSSSPDALKKRLGVNVAAPASRNHSNRQGMGETVVKTAVRASIWAAIFALFR
ncbi:hypothetical protein [Caballeronia sp. DA-9]|uniref:hypothetical protein n=1 Tax=Caballeronia sp. DA-9 TaxID=3436237 RepID=UPI003F671444